MASSRGVDSAILREAVIVFASPADADRLVAGLPAAARVAREVALAGITRCTIAAPDWLPKPATRTECLRLAEQCDVFFGNLRDISVTDGVLLIVGDHLPVADAIRQAATAPHHPAHADATGTAGLHRLSAEDINHGFSKFFDGNSAHRLKAHGRAILRSTSKASDGIVSRNINRPISRSISRMLLIFPGIRPIHATFGTALLALAMVASLIWGEQLWGEGQSLLAGALLFQAASVFDGVDGEIARATFRTSRAGAALDSLVDAATNLGFLFGVAINLLIEGRFFPAWTGFAGMFLLGIGLALIGRASIRSHAPFSFDVVKNHYREKAGKPHSQGRNISARIMPALTFLTSRDFFALGFTLLIAVGLASQALTIFAMAAAGWLIAVVLALAPKRA